MVLPFATMFSSRLLCEQGSVLHEATEPDIRQVPLREDRDDPRQRSRLGRVDPPDPRVGVVGVAEPCEGHTGEGEVGRVAPETGHLLFPVGADERRCH
jgi:hypothetical protein